MTLKKKSLPSTIWNPTFTSVVIANMGANMGQFMMNTLVPKYASFLGASATMVGLVASSFAISALVLKLFAGPMIDTYNKKYLAFAATLVIMVAFWGYSVSTNVAMVIGFRMLHGAAVAFTTASFMSIAGSALPLDKVGTGIGYFALGQAISQALGPTIGLELVEVIGYNKTFLVGALVMCASSVLVLTIRGQKRSDRKLNISLNSIVAKEALPSAIMLFFLGMAYCNISSFLVVFADTLHLNNIGYYFTVYAVTLFISRPVIGRLTDKFGFRRVILPSLCCFGLSLVLISVSSQLWMFLLAAVAAAFGYGACEPTMQALAMKAVPDERRGSASSTNYIGTDFGYMLGPTIAGAVVDLINHGDANPTGYRIMFFCLTIPVVMVAVLLMTVLKKPVERIEKTPQV